MIRGGAPDQWVANAMGIAFVALVVVVGGHMLLASIGLHRRYAAKQARWLMKEWMMAKEQDIEELLLAVEQVGRNTGFYRTVYDEGVWYRQVVDTGAGSWATLLRLLAQHGRFIIEYDDGKRVQGHWSGEAEPPKGWLR